METATLERKYSARAATPGYEACLRLRSVESAKVRARAKCALDVPYGGQSDEKVDIYFAERTSKAMLVFIHGGYWRAQDKRDYAFLVPELVKAGVTVAVPNYSLCPAVTVEDIVRQIIRATAWLFRNAGNFAVPENRLYVAGISAGGHLAAMMMAVRWPEVRAGLPAKVVGGSMCISGLYDLRPLTRVPSINSFIRMTPKTARRVSPISYPPATDAPVYLAVGDCEASGFVEQLQMMRRRWKRVVRDVLLIPRRNHFDVLYEYQGRNSPLFTTTLEMMAV